MKTHARRGEAGFSFVELLVTIIIAGIAFAALVPLFVQAQKQTSADKMRLLASNIAQDRLEKVRQVDYELLTQAGLTDNTVPSFGHFGTSWTQETASGTKQFTIGYTVVENATAATKTVTVSVDWVGPPNPHKTVTMSTVVYRQWMGPTLSWSFAPEGDPVTTGTLAITVNLDPADVDAMKPYTIGTKTLQGRVVFMIEPVGGAPLPIQTVYYSAATSGGTRYTYQWPVPGSNGSLDGNYWIRAVAYTTNGYPGNTLSTFRRVETGPPQPVADLAVMAGNASATLTWTPSVSGDVDYYEVYRRDVGTGGDAQKIAGGEGWLDVGYFDRGDDGLGLPTGTYEYTVYTVDLAGNKTSASVSIEILNNVDEQPPEPATNLIGSFSGGSVTLSWGASPSAFTTHYFVYQDGVMIAPLPKTTTTHTVNQGYDTTAVYQVKASSFGVESDWAGLGPFGTGCSLAILDGAQWLQVRTNPQYFTLTITNQLRQGNTRYTLTSLTLKQLVGTSWTTIPTPGGLQQYSNVAYDAAVNWTMLTPGQYQWTWTSPGGNGTAGDTFTGSNANEAATVRR